MSYFKIFKIISVLACYLLFSGSIFGFLEDYEQEAKAVEIEMQKAISECKKAPTSVGRGATGPIYLKNCEGDRAYLFKKYTGAGSALNDNTSWSMKDSVANEVLAYLIDRFIFGKGKAALYGVPPTYPISLKLDHSSEGVQGSAQKYIPKSYTLADTEISLEQLHKGNFTPLHFQFLTMNGDAKKDNILYDETRYYSIDNGLIFMSKDQFDRVTNKSWFFEYAPKNRLLQEGERAILSRLNLDDVDERLKQLVEFIKTKFDSYDLSNEKRLIFRFGLELAKQIAESNNKIEDWMRLLTPKQFLQILNDHLPSIDLSKNEWIDFNILIDWNAVRASFKQAIEQK